MSQTQRDYWLDRLIEAITKSPVHGVSATAKMIRLLAQASEESGCLIHGQERTYSDFDLEGGTRGKLHRAINETLAGRVLPAELVVRHTCDVKGCINPSHLIHGTPSQNTRDAYERDLMSANRAHGEAVHTCQLTGEKVAEMRRLAKAGIDTRELADRFGVGYSTAWSAVTGKTWKHIAEAPRPADKRTPYASHLAVDDPEAVKSSARQRWERGESMRSISRDLGVSTSSIVRWAKSWRAA